MISEHEAQVIAQKFLDQRFTTLTFRFGPTPQRAPNDWGMVFDRITPEGSVLDGPIVVLVDKQTGRARTLEQAIEEGWRG
jgi:hypothetical protein